jgi:hypothetical protein
MTNKHEERLLFLDQTLEGMIKRFEDEFPETRLTSAVTSPPLPDSDITQISPAESIDLTASHTSEEAAIEPLGSLSDDEYGLKPVLSRHNSDVSLASRALSQEEGRMHRFGQKFRRDILKPEGPDHEHGTTGLETQPMHLQLLRAMVEGIGGEELRNKIEHEGQDKVLEELGNEASALRRQLIEQDPEGWRKFVESQEAAQRNLAVEGSESSCSVIE